MRIKHGPRKGNPLFIKSKAAREYERSFRKQLPPAARQMLEGEVVVVIWAYYASERADLDESIILDCMQAEYETVPGKMERIGPGKFKPGKSVRRLAQRGVYINDRQVRERHVFHTVDAKNPRAIIEVYPRQPQQAGLALEIPVQTHPTVGSDEDPF